MLHAEMLEQGRLKSRSESHPAGAHGQFKFNYPQSRIRNGLETEMLTRAFRRDLEANAWWSLSMLENTAGRKAAGQWWEVRAPRLYDKTYETSSAAGTSSGGGHKITEGERLPRPTQNTTTTLVFSVYCLLTFGFHALGHKLSAITINRVANSQTASMCRNLCLGAYVTTRPGRSGNTPIEETHNESNRAQHDVTSECVGSLGWGLVDASL